MNRNSLKTPTGRRQTSWLFTKRAGVEFGATEDKSIQWQGGGLEPGTSGLQVQRPNHQATLASLFRTDNTFQVKGTGRGQIYSGKHIFDISFISPFTLKHQYPHSLYSLLYISFGTDKENLFTDLSFLGW